MQGGKSISKDLRVNQMIRAREVRLIDEENRQLGVVVLREALRIAADKGLDLVEVAPTASPVVCRIMDYGRYKYEQAKRDREARKKQLVVDIKELKMGPNIEDHDFEVRVKNAERFLREGDKLKATIQFRGRQIQHSVLGRQVLARFAERLRDLAVVEADPRMEGRNMHIIMAPRPEILARARAGRGELERAEGAEPAAERHAEARTPAPAVQAVDEPAPAAPAPAPRPSSPAPAQRPAVRPAGNGAPASQPPRPAAAGGPSRPPSAAPAPKPAAPVRRATPR
jgi:translation initiation factor IF-3